MFSGVIIGTADERTADELYPDVNADATGVVGAPSDGTDVDRVIAKGIRVVRLGSGSKEEILSATDLRLDVGITDSRLTIACPKYDKGGGWIGGVGSIALNAGSKMLAASRRRGKCLVGHVWYQWIIQVGYLEKTGWLTEETLRLLVEDGTQSDRASVVLELTFAKNVSASRIAHEVARRAASHRRDMRDDLNAEDLEALQQAEQGRFETTSDPKKWTAISLPGPLTVRPSTAGVVELKGEG